MNMIYRLHWDGWTRDVERKLPPDVPQFANSTYFVYLVVPPTGFVPGDLRMLVSPPAWRFNLSEHEIIKADGMDETVIAHYIADEPPWEAWNRYHQVVPTVVDTRPEADQQC